jgi:hypothetical protein
MMEAASTSETSVNFYQTTRRNIPQDSLSSFQSCLSRRGMKISPKSMGNRESGTLLLYVPRSTFPNYFYAKSCSRKGDLNRTGAA